MPAERISLERDHVAGFRQSGTPAWFSVAFTAVGSDGAEGSPLPAGTDRSGSITVGGTRQQVAAANTSRRGFTLQNTSDTEMRVTENGVNASATTGYQIPAGGTFRANTNRAIDIFCATTGKVFAATEW